MTAHDERELPVAPRPHIFTNPHDHVSQNTRRWPYCSEVEDPDHRSVLSVLGHEALYHLGRVRIVPDRRTCPSRHEPHIEMNLVQRFTLGSRSCAFATIPLALQIMMC